jgi:hypothetical protein
MIRGVREPRFDRITLQFELHPLSFLSIFLHLQSTNLSLITTLHGDAAGEGEIFDSVFQNLVYYNAFRLSSSRISTEGGRN